MTADPYHLQRFLDAQQTSLEQAMRELAAGHKRTHWIWFIFPQIAGLGTSPTAQRYAIGSLDEARAYLAHPQLGQRLLDCTQLVLAANRPISDIFGYPDDLKFHSSMTLFAHAAPDPANIFREALTRCFEGREDTATLARI